MRILKPGDGGKQTNPITNTITTIATQVSKLFSIPENTQSTSNTGIQKISKIDTTRVRDNFPEPIKSSLDIPGFKEDILKKIEENLPMLQKHKIQCNKQTPFDINHPIFKLLILKSYCLRNVLSIAERLKIKDAQHLTRIEQAFFKDKQELFFHTELFEECIEYFGLQEVKNIFDYDQLPPTISDDRNKPHPVSGKTIYQRMEQGCAIVDFCTHTGFQTGDHMSAHLFLNGVKEADIEKGEVHYLGSFAPEIRYFIEKIGIPFDKLFALDPKIIATHCGILRSLQKFAYNRHENRLIKNFDFVSGRKADNIGLEEVFNRDNIFYYIYQKYSITKLFELFQFIKNNAPTNKKISLDKYMQLQNNVLLVKSLKRHHDMQIFIKNSPALDNINRDSVLEGNQEIPHFLYNDDLWTAIKTNNHINNITGSNTTVDRNNYLNDPTKQIPQYLQDQDFLDKLYEYGELKGHLKNNRYQNIDRNIYYKNPSLLPALVEKIKKSVSSPLKNIGIIMSLSKTLKLGDSYYPVINDDLDSNILKHDGSISDKRKMLKRYREMYENHMGLYSIGGKIHVDTPIPEEKVKQFLQETGLQQTAFKLIHANTSVLLPPSYFAAELMFMIARMSDNGVLGEHGLFADDERPQLQIAIPGRLPNNLGAILGSSMILLSQKHLDYTKESFSTSHNSATGRRMVTYDAGVYDPTFTRNSDKIDGRTDIVLLRDINLIPKAQIIGSLVGQTQYDGMFAELGEQFIQDYYELLDKHNLYTMINQPRIYDSATANDEDNLEEHFQAVKAFSDRQHMDWFLFNSTQEAKGLLTFKLHKLLQTYKERIKSRQQDFK